MDPQTAELWAAIATIAWAGSELLALAPWVRANSWTQLLVAALRAIGGSRHRL